MLKLSIIRTTWINILWTSAFQVLSDCPSFTDCDRKYTFFLLVSHSSPCFLLHELIRFPWALLNASVSLTWIFNLLCLSSAMNMTKREGIPTSWLSFFLSHRLLSTSLALYICTFLSPALPLTTSVICTNSSHVFLFRPSYISCILNKHSLQSMED